MKSRIEVGSPPAKAVMIYDGDCRFCSLWIRRWQERTGRRLDYLPFQEATVADRFPEVPRSQFESAVQLVETDGHVYSGAEAVFRALTLNSQDAWLLEWYAHFPLFARASERGYSFVARHRALFSVLTRLAWGQHVERPTHFFVRSVFLRCLGAVYLLAFLSLWVQIDGLVGREGLLPVSSALDAIRLRADAENVGVNRYHLVPTLCWLNSSDAFLHWQCAAGALAAVCLMAGFAPAPCLFLLWMIYLSLTTVGREFLSYQWDALLLEAGFLAIFLAPFGRDRWGATAGPPSRVVVWLLRLLLFKLIFQSGWVKLLSGDPSWHNLTALRHHFETQPLPTWIGWYAYHLPPWAHSAMAAAMFGIELGAPFLILGPRRLRQAAGGLLLLLQIAILLTGNYGFFNWLTIALCLLLLDDVALMALFPRKLRSLSPRLTLPASAPGLGSHSAVPRRAWSHRLALPLACVVVVGTLIQLTAMFRLHLPWPRQIMTLYAGLMPLRSLNTYGLFAVMTTARREIVIEGSDDAVTWVPYEFKYKPGDLNRRPGFVAPHQPRLDWQMWFAALGTYQNNLWLVNLCQRLLEGSEPVLRLLKTNPFPNAPPHYVRAVVYDYHFTDLPTRRKTGEWWRRGEQSLYLSPLSLPEQQYSPSLRHL